MLYELQLKKEIKVQENEIVSSAKYFNNKKINTFDNGNFNCELYLKKKCYQMQTYGIKSYLQQ